jgi:hypothetical protein
VSYENRNYFKDGAWNVHCSSCGEDKTIDKYYIHSNGKPRAQCKACVLTRRNKLAPAIRKKSSDAYRQRNNAKCLAWARNWRKNNLDYDRFRAATYRARKLNQTPSWANLDKIKEIYLNCPEGYHVDHIIPLKGKLVAGLHVENNLQCLPARENLAKRNLYVV